MAEKGLDHHLPALVRSFVGRLNLALLQFRPDPDVPEQRYVQLENGCWVSVLQRIVPKIYLPTHRRVLAGTPATTSRYSRLSESVTKGWSSRSAASNFLAFL